jgi:16S rRNA (guanine527-N7)-methyltransferase
MRREYDENRTANLEGKYGIHFLRIRNEEVLNNLSTVVKNIHEELKKSPPPSGEGQGVGEKMETEKGLGVEVNQSNEAKEPMRFLDLGTGGGFPLLPLAICLPQCSFVGLDSVQKKISAVERIAQAMHLTNVSLVCGRAEELGRENAHREQYDIVLCRAVAEINVLLEYAAPFVKIGGHVLLWKSMTIEQELQDSLLARAELFCHLKGSHPYELLGNFGKRQILMFQKTSKTPTKYPREVGVPKNQPLL